MYNNTLFYHKLFDYNDTNKYNIKQLISMQSDIYHINREDVYVLNNKCSMVVNHANSCNIKDTKYIIAEINTLKDLLCILQQILFIKHNIICIIYNNKDYNNYMEELFEDINIINDIIYCKNVKKLANDNKYDLFMKYEKIIKLLVL